MDKELEELGLSLSLQEYFTYHPPKTEFRKQLHEIANTSSLVLAEALFCEIDKLSSMPDLKQQSQILIDTLLKGYQTSFQVIVKDTMCKSYINKAFELLNSALKDFADPIQVKKDVLMYVQQIRMFANQGITIDELVHQKSRQ